MSFISITVLQVKHRANGRNIVGQQLPTLLDVTCCVRLHTIGSFSNDDGNGKENFKTAIECFHSRGQHLCKFIGTKDSVCIRKEYNSQRIGLGHQYGRRDVM